MNQRRPLPGLLVADAETVRGDRSLTECGCYLRHDRTLSNVADARQDRPPEPVQSIQQCSWIVCARGIEAEIEDAGSNHLAAASDLINDRVRATDEVDRQRPVD